MNFDDQQITDNLGEPDPTIPYRYSISSYGADYPVDSLVSRLNSAAIYIPPFQRNFVWNIKQSSRFIESLLLGLPVPGIFLSRDPLTQQLIVVDGQQRLRSLHFFYRGVFADSKREFALQKVQSHLEGLTYRTLPADLKLMLDDSIIHATIIKQDEPSNDISSIYSIFERLNTGATRLTAQEIRQSLYHGPFTDLLETLNATDEWRQTFFTQLNKRKRDEELILRFFALYFERRDYQRPMEAFLNKFMGANRQLERYGEAVLTNTFVPTITLIAEQIGPKAFKPQGPFNAAVFDSVMIAVATLLKGTPTSEVSGLAARWETLMGMGDEYFDVTLRATADPASVMRRIDLAMRAFGSKI